MLAFILCPISQFGCAEVQLAQTLGDIIPLKKMCQEQQV